MKCFLLFLDGQCVNRVASLFSVGYTERPRPVGIGHKRYRRPGVKTVSRPPHGELIQSQ